MRYYFYCFFLLFLLCLLQDVEDEERVEETKANRNTAEEAVVEDSEVLTKQRENTL